MTPASNRNRTVRYRLGRWWSDYVQGIRQRYAFLMTPSQPGFFIAWLGYALFVAATLRWLIDLFVFAFLRWRQCETPAIVRLGREIEWIPACMVAGIIIMTWALVGKQTGYAKAIPLWVSETLLAVFPLALILSAAGLSISWGLMRFACR